MRWGICGSIDDASEARDAGFDFFEVNVQTVLRGAEDDATYDANAPDRDALPLPVEAANCLLPGNLPVVGPDRDIDALKTYMDRVARRAARLGIERLVFGSGKARRRPDDVEADTAFAHLVEFGRLAADACAPHDVVVVIEHLRQSETNVLNKLDECMALYRAVNHDHLQMLVDSFHFGIEHESNEAVTAIGDALQHVHVAEPVDRVEPGAADASDRFDFVNFFGLLKRVGYDQRISIESSWTKPVPEAGPSCLAYLKQAWRAAKD